MVGTLLTGASQLEAIERGAFDAPPAFRILMNYLIPFFVSNVGALAGTGAQD